jgi:serine/threonine protein phosphatase PrpC
MTLRLRYAAESDVGLVRQGNEDSGYAGPRLLMVADGMGGHAAGELASATAVAIVADLDVHPPSDTDVLSELSTSIDDAGDSIGATIDSDPELAGMGTTVTGVFWLDGRLAIVHVGDSRAYLLRDGELLQLTHDHTYVQTLVDAGRITEDEAAIHPRRSLLMRALDGVNPVEADLSIREARVGDRLLLCTDGLSGVMSAEEIQARLTDGDPTGAVTRLVDFALERGAPDNVTVVVADVIDTPASDTPVEITAADRVVVGAAGEPRVRFRLPHVRFPDDAQPDPDRPDVPLPVDGGPPTAEQPLIDSELIVPAAETARRVAARDAVEAEITRRKRRRRVVVWSIVGVLVLALAGTLLATRAWISTQWYVAVNGSAGTGTIAIYNGVPGSLLGIQLSTLNTASTVTVGELPLFDQELVSKGIPAASRDDADRIVTELAVRAAACKAVFPPAGCPGATT